MMRKEPQSYIRKEKILICALIISSILPLLDGSIVNIVLSSLSQYFHASKSSVQWVATAYFLASVPGLLICSYLQRRLGVRATWLCANLIFLLGSLATGLSYNFVTIIAARIVQGLGTGLLLPLTQSIIGSQFGPERLRQVMGTVAIPTVFAPAIGPIIGASITQYFSWRLLFFINIPLIILSIILGKKYIKTQNPEKTSFNAPAFISFSISLISFFYLPIIIHKNYPKTVYIFIAMSFISFIIFILINYKSRTKLILLSGFNNFDYCLLIFMGLMTAFIFFSFLVFYPLVKLQNTSSSLNLLLIGAILGLQGVGAWLGRQFIYQKWKEASPFFMLGLGLLIATIGLLFFGHTFTLDAIGFLIRGMGFGIATIVCLTAPLQYSAKHFIKDTAVITRIAQQIGGACGGIFTGLLIHMIFMQKINLNQAYLVFLIISFIILIILITIRSILKNY